MLPLANRGVCPSEQLLPHRFIKTAAVAHDVLRILKPGFSYHRNRSDMIGLDRRGKMVKRIGFE